MKKFLIVSIALFGLCSASFAQNKLKSAKQKPLQTSSSVPAPSIKKIAMQNAKQNGQSSVIAGPRPEAEINKQN